MKITERIRNLKKGIKLAIKAKNSIKCYETFCKVYGNNYDKWDFVMDKAFREFEGAVDILGFRIANSITGKRFITRNSIVE